MHLLQVYFSETSREFTVRGCPRRRVALACGRVAWQIPVAPWQWPARSSGHAFAGFAQGPFLSIHREDTERTKAPWHSADVCAD